jgi:ABC-type ATPase with predicted acetyltransferase domain
MQMMNGQLAMLSRVVLHPAYRGAGLAARFVRRSCELSGILWIEALTAMGRINPVFEKAGFVRVGPTRGGKKTRVGHSTLYKRPLGRRTIRVETHEKSRRAAPVYYIFDNRDAASRSRPGREADET